MQPGRDSGGIQKRPGCLVLLASLSLVGQAPEEASHLDTLLNTPVVSASKRVQTYLEAPQAMEVITRKQIRQMGAFRLQDVLRQATSLKLLEMDPLNVYAGVRGNLIEGYPKNLQVLIDGVPFYNGVRGAIDLDNLPIPIQMVDRIEIVRGPSSPLYGAGAVGGVVAIYTSPQEGQVVSGRLGAAEDRFRHSLVISHGRGGWRIHAGLDGSSQGDSGALNRPLGAVAPIYRPSAAQQAELSHDAAHQYRALVRAGLTWVDSTFSLAAGRAEKVTGVNFGTGFTVPWETFDNQFVQGSWRQVWSGTFRTEAAWHTLGLKAVTGPYTSSPTILYDQEIQQASLQGNFDPDTDFHLVAGCDARWSTASSVLVGIREAKDKAWGGFAIVDWGLLPAWTLSFGGRYEHDTLGGSRISPRAVVHWALRPNTSLQFGYYTSARSPQVLEARIFASTPSRIIPNPELKEERTDSLECGFRTDWRGWTFDVTAFEMRYEDLIARMTVAPTPAPTGTRQYVNVSGTARSRGVEWLVQRTSDGWTHGFNGTLLSFRDRNGQDYAYTPKTALNLFLRLDRGRWRGYASIQSFSGYTIGNYLGTPTFEAVGARVRGQFNLECRLTPHLSLAIHGLNLGGSQDAQGAGGALQSPILRGSHRELGASLACTW